MALQCPLAFLTQAPPGLGGTGASGVPKTVSDLPLGCRQQSEEGFGGKERGRQHQSHSLHPLPSRIHTHTLAPGEVNPCAPQRWENNAEGGRAFQRRPSVPGGATEAEHPLPTSSWYSLPCPPASVSSGEPPTQGRGEGAH